MNRYIIFVISLVLLQSCKERNPLLSLYVFSIDDIYVNYYIDINSDSTMIVTKGMETDTVRYLMLDGGEFKQNVDMFISHIEYPNSIYIESDSCYHQLPYKKRERKIAFLNNMKMSKIKQLICQLNHTCPKEPFINEKDENNHMKQKNIRHWHWKSYGVIMMTGEKTFKFWYDDMSKEEQQLFEYIKRISPMKIEPIVDTIGCLGGHRL